MMHALQSEFFRLRKRPQTWIMPVLAVGFIGAFYGVIFLLYHFGQASSRDDMQRSAEVVNIFQNGVQVWGFFGAILTVIVTSSLIGSEYGWNTLRPLVARARTRSALLSAKWIIVVLYTVMMVVVGVLGALVLAAITSLLVDAPVSLPTEYIGDFAVWTLRWIVATLPYAVIAFSVALLTRSNAAGIAVGIGLSFVEPLVFQLMTLASDIFETAQKFGIAWNVTQVANVTTEPNDFMEPVSASQAWQSTGVLLVYVAVAIAASFLIFNRRDIVSG